MSSAVAPAEAYDRHTGRYGRELSAAFVGFAGLEPGMRVLDVGCGTGALTSRLAQIVGWLHDRFGDAAERPDLPALALVLVESISAYHSLRRTFARTPDSVDDERFIAAWTETALAVSRRYGIDERREH